MVDQQADHLVSDYFQLVVAFHQADRLEEEGYGPILRAAGLASDVPDEALKVPLEPGFPVESGRQAATIR